MVTILPYKPLGCESVLKINKNTGDNNIDQMSNNKKAL